jgi:tetratricopeptide (TPR) repeat protein
MNFDATRRRFAVWTFVLPTVAVFGFPAAARQTPAASTADLLAHGAADFPPGDIQVWGTERRGLTARAAAAALVTAPESAQTIRLLVQAGRIDDALHCLAHIVPSQPGSMAAAFEAVLAGNVALQTQRAAGYSARLAEIADTARAQLPNLPRDQAARLARVLVNVDNNSARGGSRGYGQRLDAFLREYAGTAEAPLAEVDRLQIGPAEPAEQALGIYGHAHPGTVAGAKALYTRAMLLAMNAPPRTPPGSDPTDRFLAVIDAVHELEDGTWPDCDWVRRAPDLVARLFAYRPTYSPAHLDALIDAFGRFAAAHFSLDQLQPMGNGVGYPIASKLADLYAVRGDEAAAMAHAFDDLERAVPNRTAVRYLRALYAGRVTSQGSAVERAARIEASNTLLREVASDGDGVYRQKALATLGSQQFALRDYTHATRTFREYLSTYPQSAWAWLAAIRLGQSQAALGDQVAARDTFRLAAATYTSVPMAATLASGLAARANEALGKFSEALADLRRAAAAWDESYGPTYALPAPDRPSGGLVPSAETFDRDDLASRVATLTASLAEPGGADLERGRWQVEQGHWTDARTTLERVISAHGRSRVAAEARTLAHRARFEQALAMADVASATPNESAAMTALASLAREPSDFYVLVSKIARAFLLWKAGQAAPARALIRQALDQWRTAQPTARPPAEQSLDADVVAIRNVVFRPLGGGVYGLQRWNAFTWPAALPAYLVVSPVIDVRDASGHITRVTTYQRFPGLDSVLFFDADQIACLTKTLDKLGGTRKRQPRTVMETPNQPVGPSLDLVDLLGTFFEARPGHWAGWELLTYPQITRVDFLDTARTKATARVTIGYAGATVVLEKTDGVWTATALTDRWVT